MAWVDYILFDGEQRSVVRGVRIAVALSILFIVALVQSCDQFRYAISGVEATGIITNVQESTAKRGHWFVNYNLHEGTKVHRLKMTLPPGGGTPAPGDSVEVVYVPGAAEWAVLASERSWFWPSVLLVLLVALSAVCYRSYQLAEQGRI